MDERIQIHVALLNEAVDVWRPIEAVRVQASTYRIVDQPYDRAVERWQFEPGDEVVCEVTNLSGGPALVAVRRSR